MIIHGGNTRYTHCGHVAIGKIIKSDWPRNSQNYRIGSHCNDALMPHSDDTGFPFIQLSAPSRIPNGIIVFFYSNRGTSLSAGASLELNPSQPGLHLLRTYYRAAHCTTRLSALPPVPRIIDKTGQGVLGDRWVARTLLRCVDPSG